MTTISAGSSLLACCDVVKQAVFAINGYRYGFCLMGRVRANERVPAKQSNHGQGTGQVVFAGTLASSTPQIQSVRSIKKN
jgi:hypothetical protein